MESKCVICNEPTVTQSVSYCKHCADNIPLCIISLASGNSYGTYNFGNDENWPSDNNFNFNKDNWMLFSNVIKRNKELRHPIEIRNSLTGTIHYIEESCPTKDMMIVRRYLERDTRQVSISIFLNQTSKNEYRFFLPWRKEENNIITTQTKDLKDFPHTCRCGSPAYINIFTNKIVECFNPNCPYC